MYLEQHGELLECSVHQFVVEKSRPSEIVLLNKIYKKVRTYALDFSKYSIQLDVIVRTTCMNTGTGVLTGLVWLEVGLKSVEFLISWALLQGATAALRR